ncbi:MAG: Ig-like domain-containing protein [Gemmatimonadales bacterium]
MVLSLLLLLAQQQPAPPQIPRSGIARVEVTPQTTEIQVGQAVQFRARAVDSAGREVPGTLVRWSIGGFGGGSGTVDSTGLVRAGYKGTFTLNAIAMVPGKSGRGVSSIEMRVVPSAAARISITPRPGQVLTGTRLTLAGTAYSAEGDRRSDPVAFSSSNPRVATVTPDGRLTAVAPGVVTITGRAGPATATLPVEVVANRVAQLSLDPPTPAVLTGDVVRFTLQARDRNGRPVRGFPVRWAVAGGEGVAQVDADGAFVAENPGTYTVTATLGAMSADAVIRVRPRRVTRGIEVVGRVPIKYRSAEVWAHPSGECVYLSTISDRVYAIDITAPEEPRIVDSMMSNSQIVNDVMTTEDGRYGVFSREGSPDRKNGIMIFDAADPCHPKVIAQYTETVTGGVHSAYVYQGHVYLTDDATGSLRVIDISNPYEPREVARWQAEQTEIGRYVHDVAVADGLAYLSYWNDGLIILDVGNGVKGGSPEQPRFVSQYKYDLDALYARVDQIWGLGARGTHTAWRDRNYVFIGDEVYASRGYKGLKSGNDLTFGRLQVLDVSDLEHPRLVAWYEPTDGGVHNIWVAGDTLYMGTYQGGARMLDISGELKGDLLRQGREISWISTADSMGTKPRSTFAWGAVVQNGNIFVPDINSGLWILRLEPREEKLTP